MKKIILTLTIGAISSLIASDSAALFKKCTACHGEKAEKKALGRSDIIKNWSANKIEKRLIFFRDKKVDADEVVMKNQVKNFSDKDIKEIAKYISSLK